MLKTTSLMPVVKKIILEKATETPFTGEYEDFDQPGTYLCRQCGWALFRAQHKFHSGCGWPSFDDEIVGRIKKLPDQDGRRIEILCQRCEGHLGHIFSGEGFTKKNIRYCVNAASLDFINNLIIDDTEEAIFAGGCFWGIEHLFKKLPGVVKTEVGYTGGHKLMPIYQEVCEGTTAHVEAIRVLYDPLQIDYQELTKYFLEIHDPTQANGQGPDIGSQYLSVIFYYTEIQKTVATTLINQLKQAGLKVVTKIFPTTIFWPAEVYHQDYYTKTGKKPYCHVYTKRFKG
ncbi:MAG: peptide-methionine (S)-S-oxide reductase [Gammaproteobacteria bacterium RIFCSPHIGHO2_12_FULL_35_23]|nr:MAG: peptide-methionine (S)-S-oxide reductase [Gammaproteobacteria bacterium RIFCSPHIGHO2_12_FULL_35_23]